MPPPVGRARLAVLGAVLAFSTGGAAIKASTYGGLQVAGLRSAIAAVVLLTVVPEARRSWPTPGVVLVAVAYAAMMVTFAVSNKLTTAANAIFLQSTFPMWVVLLGPWLLGERPRRADLALLAVMGAGVALIAVAEDAPTGVATHPALGNAVALAAGFFWALVVMGLRWLGRDDGGNAAAAAALGNVLAAVVALPVGAPFLPPAGTDVVALGWLGVVQVGLAYVLLTRAVRHLDAVQASLLLLLEPAISPAWAWLMHDEVPSRAALAGGGLVVLAMGARSLGTALATRRGEAPGGAG